MELVLVCHAHPELQSEVTRRGDPGPSATGTAAAEAVASRLRHDRWDALYTAPLRETLETAAIVASRLGLEARAAPALAERGNGGETTAAIETIIAAHPGQRVLVVTSGRVINGFVSGFLGSAKPVLRRPDRTGVTGVLAGRSGRRELVCLNDSTHLRLPWRAPVTKEL
ncbi:histidine phosphatase family protein [Amycolatopsis sp. K13G38]|uniref:Histidine phosphatase family protein n=1 Tax=Amycolatopsis acididurans TaxID=2724524 RepID=A0ABX1J3B0_9PSEU|nr:histidine phosphatase family protein [Amycolatopsis acididurans]NKQ54273.1 histidine phosphatase family protein [Amycolatopsis acididurans]